jgi:hypothetical protein
MSCCRKVEQDADEAAVRPKAASPNRLDQDKLLATLEVRQQQRWIASLRTCIYTWHCGLHAKGWPAALAALMHWLMFQTTLSESECTVWMIDSEK